jgi:hypothetical protein
MAPATGPRRIYRGYTSGERVADLQADWARQMPRNVTALWAFVAELDHDSRLTLLAHCVALTVNAVRLPWETSLAPTRLNYFEPLDLGTGLITVH